MSTAELKQSFTFDDTEIESAPLTGADFLTVISSPRSRPTRAPVVRLLHEKPVPTHEGGMVDIDGLETFLHPNPSNVPLYATRGWKYHHINHPKSSFRQTAVPADERDQSLVLYRNSPYQQVHMRVTSEDIYHRLHHVEVEHPAEEAVDAALRDFEKLNMLGAATLMLSLLKGNGNHSKDADPVIWSRVDEDPKKTYKFISDVRSEYADAVVRAEIVSPRLVTSALKRLSMHLHDPFLSHMADTRLNSDPVFYPVKVPSMRYLMITARQLFPAVNSAKANEGSSTESVQTGDNRLQLVP